MLFREENNYSYHPHPFYLHKIYCARTPSSRNHFCFFIFTFHLTIAHILEEDKYRLQENNKTTTVLHWFSCKWHLFLIIIVNCTFNHVISLSWSSFIQILFHFNFFKKLQIEIYFFPHARVCESRSLVFWICLQSRDQTKSD